MRDNIFEIIKILRTKQIPDATLFQKTLVIFAVAAAGYILGSLCFAVIFTKIFTGKDIRDMGSGTAGTANVLRNVGIIPGLLTGVFDFIKGAVGVYIGFILFNMVEMEMYAGGCFATIFVLLGHFYPIFFKYKGGKGVVAMGGIVAVLNLKLFLMLLLVYLGVLLGTKITSLAAVVTFFMLPIANFVLCMMDSVNWIASTSLYLCVSLLIFLAHKDNIKRLKEGTEPKLIIKKQKDN